MSSEPRSPAIETMFLEERRYPPPEEFAAQANAQPDIYDRDFEEFWEPEGRERVTWFEPFTSSTSGAAICEVVPGRHAQHLLQLRRSPRRGRPGREGRLLLGGRARGRAADDHVRRSPARGGPARQRAEEARRRQGHGGRDLHGHGARGPGRDARVRAPRRPAHGRLRRLLGRLAVRPSERHGLRGADHPGRGVAQGAAGAAEAERRRGARRRARASSTPSSCAGRGTRCRCRRAATCGGTSWSPTRGTTPRAVPASRWTRRICSTCCTRRGRPRSRRGSRTRPPATSSASRRRTTTSSTSSPTPCTGARPTSAG